MHASRARGLAGVAIVMVTASTAVPAEEALRPPPGYYRAVPSGRHGATPPCPTAPPPFTAVLDFPSKYAGSGSARDQLNVESDSQYKLATRPITEMEKGVAHLVNSYMESGDPGQLACAIGWLSGWAEAGALEAAAANHTGRSLRKWSLASLSSAYLRLEYSSSAPLRNYPAQAARIEAWFGEIANHVHREWPADDPVHKINNHYYWAAWSLMATAVATHRHDLFEQSLALYDVFAAQVDEDGYLPSELARASRAVQYHDYALQPIAMIAAFAKANGVDLTARGHGALARFVARTQSGLEDPAGFAVRAGSNQDQGYSESSSTWAWLEPYCWTVSCPPGLLAQRAARRPIAATRLGGNLSALFADPAP